MQIYGVSQREIRKAILILDLVRLVSFSPLLLNYAELHNHNYEEREERDLIAVSNESSDPYNSRLSLDSSLTLDVVISSSAGKLMYSTCSHQ